MIKLKYQRLLVLLPLMTLLALNLQLLAGLDRSKLGQVTCGKTSADELMRLFGKPKTSQDQPDGGKTFIYQEGKFVPSAILTLQLTPGGIVRDYSLQEMNVKLRGPKLDPAALDKIKESQTTEAEVEKLLGKPTMKSVSCDGAKTAVYVFGGLRGGESRIIAYDSTGLVVSVSGGTSKGARGGLKEPIDDKKWAMLVEGRSTEKEVIDLLGEPAGSGSLPDGTHGLTYYHGDLSGSSVAYSVEIGPDGVVVGLSRFFSSWDPERKRMQMGVKIDPDRWKAIVPETTTDGEILEWFGPPTMARPHPDGRKTYLYQYAEGVCLADFQSGSQYSVTFDPRGIVAATSQEGLPTQLRPIQFDEKTTAAWDKCETDKPVAEAMPARLTEPTRAIKSPDGAVVLLYLYQIDAASLEARWAGFDRVGRWLGTQRSQWLLRDLNGLGRQYARARWSAFQPGQTGVAQVVEALGAPAYILELTDRGSMYLYVTGQVSIEPQIGKLPVASQSYSLCILRFDDTGVLRSFQAD